MGTLVSISVHPNDVIVIVQSAMPISEKYCKLLISFCCYKLKKLI
jgi:hypothetical protein